MAYGTPDDDDLSNEDAANYGFDGNDIIVSKLLSGSAYMEGGNGNDILTMANGGSARLEAWGGSGDDWLSGDDGNDYLVGGIGSDLVEGGIGKDYLNGGSERDGLYGSDGDDSLFGVDGDDYRVLLTITLQDGPISFYGGLYGGAGNDSLDGGAGADWLDGGTGNDKLYGGTGDDTFFADSRYDQIFEQAGEGYDIVTVASFEFHLEKGQEIEELHTENTSVHLSGNEFGQFLFGHDGGNNFNGGGGADLFYGRKGSDTYVVDSADDRVFENAGEGYDGVLALASYVLAPGQEIETLTAGAASIDLTGNEFGQGLYGGEGVNVLRGEGGGDSLYGGGGDLLYGGAGDDFYLIQRSDSPTEPPIGVPAIFEKAGEGNDRVVTLLETYALPADAEIELLMAGRRPEDPLRDFTLTGNALAQTIIGEAGNDVLSDGGGAGGDAMAGGGGDDTYHIGNGGTTVGEAIDEGEDTVFASVDYVLGGTVFVEVLRAISAGSTASIDLTGNTLKQTIIGNAGNNRLDDGGGAGADTLQGLGGTDTYYVRNAGTIVQEASGGGSDTVYAALDYKLGVGVAVEVLRAISAGSTAGIDLTGNALVQTIIGNAGANRLNDGGGAGADTLQGLGGDDTYRISSANAVILEAAGGGNDTVASSASYVLKAGVAVETLRTSLDTGTLATDLTGNALKQTIIGNAGANRLDDGGGAADVLQGLGGNDTYYVRNAGTTVQEAAGGGSDGVYAALDYVLGSGVQVETLRAIGVTSTASIDLTGNEFAQALMGNAGSNILDGKYAGDTLTGLGGKDFFVFSSTLSSSNIDVITDFNVADDTIRLQNAVFTKLVSTGTLSFGSFRASASGAAGDSNDYILYDTDDGRLFYDADGNGAGAKVQFATLTGAPTITNLDFVVI